MPTNVTINNNSLSKVMATLAGMKESIMTIKALRTINPYREPYWLVEPREPFTATELADEIANLTVEGYEVLAPRVRGWDNYNAIIRCNCEDFCYLAELEGDDRVDTSHGPVDHSLVEIKTFIEEGFDPAGVLLSGDDPGQILKQVDTQNVAATGVPTTLTLEDVRKYLAWLATEGR